MKRGNEKGLDAGRIDRGLHGAADPAHHGGAAGACRVRVERERELRAALREMHAAIDKYKDNCDAGYFGPMKAGHQLLAGDRWSNWWKASSSPTARTARRCGFLRKIPRDPFTGKYEWGMRSDQDDPKSMSWGGQNVFDVYSKTYERAPDGKPYSEW